MEKMVLYTHPKTRGRNVVWMLEECGAEYETVLVNLSSGLQDPDFLAINPMGKLPALQYGDAVITEAAAIITFLADLYPQAQLAPSVGTAERGGYYRWLFFSVNSVEAALMEAAFHFNITPDMRKTLGYGSLERVLQTIDSQLAKQPYLLGNAFQSCDLVLSGLLMLAIRSKTLTPTAAMQDYLARIMARPAFQAMLTISEQQQQQLTD